MVLLFEKKAILGNYRHSSQISAVYPKCLAVSEIMRNFASSKQNN
jgi:hypothetical protein